MIQDDKTLRQHMQSLNRRMTVLGTILIALLTVNMILILGNQHSIMVMQTDTLDRLTLMDLNSEMDRLAPSQEDLWEEWDKDVIQEPVDPTATYQLSPDEFALVCRVVMSESGGEDLMAQMAVAQTIYDRMHDFGESLPDAIRTYSQHDNGYPTDSVRLAVANVFENGMRVYEGGTYQFHDDSVSPYWTEGKIARGSIGNLRFYGGYAE